MEESVRFKPTASGSFNPLSMYPVGSIYQSVNPTDPSELFGGTWQMLKDVFLMAAGGKYAAGSTGGEAQHKLTVGEMPRHLHAERMGDKSSPKQIQNALMLKDKNATGTAGAFLETDYATTGLSSNPVQTFSEGGSQPHNNLPPYLAVYTWVRTA